MKTPSTWILLPLTGFLLLGASACGKGDPGRQIRTKDQQGAYDMMDQATVRCDDPAKCHSGIAMLVGVEQFDEDGDTKWGVGECTGFLIAPDILATNSHCIADTLKDKGDGADCSGEAQIFFPAFGNYAEKRVDCAKILKASQIGSTHEAPDYAFVKLSEPVTDREIIALDNSGFEDRQKIRIIKVDPTSKHKPVGSMTSNECIALRKTIILQSSDSALSPTLALGDCDVIHGNSGSPIFDEAGHARGILYAKMEEDGYQIVRGLYGNLLHDGPAAPLGFATNLGCVQTPLAPNRTLEASCLKTMTLRFPDPSDFQNPPAEPNSEKSKKELESLFSSWSLQNEKNSPVRWRVSTNDDGTALPLPECLLPLTGWIGHYSDILGDQERADLYLRVPTWGRGSSLNRYLQLQSGYRAVKSQDARLRFSPRAIRASGGGSGDVNLQVSDSYSYTSVFETTLRACQ